MRIRSLPDLISMMNRYKNNPMILSYYNGNDWKKYTLFDQYNVKEVFLSKNLYLVNCLTFQKYKIKNNDIIKVLDGSVIVDSSKRIDNGDIPYIYDKERYYKYNQYDKYTFNDIYTGSDGKLNIYINNINNINNNQTNKDTYGICEGKSIYNTFLHYRSL